MRCFLNFYPGTADKSANTLLWQAGLHHVRLLSIALDQSVLWGTRQLPSVALKRRCKVRYLSRHLSLLTLLSTVLCNRQLDTFVEFVIECMYSDNLYKLGFVWFLVRVCDTGFLKLTDSLYAHLHWFILSFYYFHSPPLPLLCHCNLPSPLQSSRFLIISSLSLQEQFYFIDFILLVASTLKYVFSIISFFLYICTVYVLS